MNRETAMSLTDGELLKEYQRIAKALVNSKNEELCFLADHQNRDFWDDEQDDEYSELLAEIESVESEFSTLNEIVSKRLENT